MFVSSTHGNAIFPNLYFSLSAILETAINPLLWVAITHMHFSVKCILLIVTDTEKYTETCGQRILSSNFQYRQSDHGQYLIFSMVLVWVYITHLLSIDCS